MIKNFIKLTLLSLISFLAYILICSLFKIGENYGSALLIYILSVLFPHAIITGIIGAVYERFKSRL